MLVLKESFIANELAERRRKASPAAEHRAVRGIVCILKKSQLS